MELFQMITYNFTNIYTELLHLDEDEWLIMIRKFFNRLAEKETGSVIVDRLKYFLLNGYKITISNNDFITSHIIYPKIKYNDPRNVFIVIPSVPYFTKVQVISKSLCEDCDDEFLQNMNVVANGLPSSFKINFNQDHSMYRFLIKNEKMSNFISFVHELVHCLRHFEGLTKVNDEDNTIYGINGTVLTYKDNVKEVYITENSIRKEWGYRARVSHSSIDEFCYGAKYTYKNKDAYTKEDFYR